MNPSADNQVNPSGAGAPSAVPAAPYVPPMISPAGLPMPAGSYQELNIQHDQPPAAPTMAPATAQSFVPAPQDLYTPPPVPAAAPLPPPPPPAPVYQAPPVPQYAPAPQQVYAPTQPAATPPVVSNMPAHQGDAKVVAPAKKPNSTQNALQIAEIRDGIVIMSDGSYRSVIMVKSINFDLMSPQEQEAVEYAYQSFLNSLYFPVQIFLRSQRVDLQPYIEKLDKIRTEHDNMLLALLMEDYIGYIDALSQQTNIMDKKFYVIVPYSPRETDAAAGLNPSKNFFKGLTEIFAPKEKHVVINEAELESAKTELRNRVQAALSGLLQSGIQGLPLDTQELIELYYDTYNPDTATRQELKNFNDLTADVITKGQGAAPQAHLQRELQ